MEAEKITTEELDRVRRKVEAKGLAAQSVKHVLAQIKRVLRYGQSLGLLVIPSGLVFHMPKVDNRKTEHMTKEQLAAYLKALDEEEDQDAAAFLRLELLTGMRRGAVMGLMWQDCNFENDSITLRGETAKSGKTKHIPMASAVKSILQAINRTGDYVFPGKDGGPRKDFRRIAQRVRDKAGLPKDFRYNHGLRHTFASALASSGKVTLQQIKDLLTHDSVAMTLRYTHLVNDALMQAASVAENMLAPEKENN